MIKFNCTHCGKNVTAQDHFAGKRAKCPGCKKPIQIPAAEDDVETGFEAVEESGFEAVDDAEAVTEKPVVRKPVKAGAKTSGIRAKPKPDNDDVPMAEAVDDDEEEDRPRRKRRVADDDDDDDDDDRPRRRRRRRRGQERGRSGYMTCPDCGSDAAQRVAFTWWGGFIGPMILNHVACQNCGSAYNGSSGKSNNTAIAIYTGVELLITVAVLALILLLEFL
jgi:DNA-directed RNA polymerase subunit RPC12/RpoP